FPLFLGFRAGAHGPAGVRARSSLSPAAFRRLWQTLGSTGRSGIGDRCDLVPTSGVRKKTYLGTVGGSGARFKPVPRGGHAMAVEVGVRSAEGSQTVFVDRFCDGIIGPGSEMLGPVRDGGHIVANTAPGCWGPMITPAIKGGHEVTLPVAVEGAEVGDAA